MSVPHTLLELRVGRTTVTTPEAAVQLFATLPTIHNRWWHRILQKEEHISFEIVVENQTIYFVCHCPTRLVEYVSGILTACYPHVLISTVDQDPMLFFTKEILLHPSQPELKLACGTMRLQNSDALPLKTFEEFSGTDPLLPLLSTLSGCEEHDRVVVQYCISQENQHWKSSGIQTTPDPQQSLIDRKASLQSLAGTIRLAVGSTTKQRAKLLLESIGQTFQTFTNSTSNRLELHKVYFFQNLFLKRMKQRQLWGSSYEHFSLAEVATLFHLPGEKLVGVNNIAWGKKLLGEAPENLPIVKPDMDPEIKKEINCFARTNYKNTAAVYGLHRNDRRRHMYVIGKTGTGKSTMLANMAINDLKNNEGICVIDPHGDLVEALLEYIPSHRINDTIYFDPSDPERTVKLNLFEGNNVVHRELIASGIVSVFRKLYAYSWGPRLEYILRNALLTLLKAETARLSDVVDLLTDAEFRRKIVDTLDDEILKNFWINEFDAMQDKLRTEAIAPILNKVGQFVSSPLVRDVVNARKSSFSIEEAMDQGKILLVNLSQGKLGEDNATLLGAMLITKIQLAAMARVNTPESERRDFYLYVDEFQNFATESFTKILSEARKYRLNLILANQYIAQIPEDVQKAIFGNCGSIVSFVMGADDASIFTKEFGDHYTNEDLVSLARHQIINKLTIDNQISQPFPGETLPPSKSKNGNKEKVLRASSERYARKK
ncbi:type IV secretion system DNA-binding domain-containing protein [Candidatus Woesebacteria bacterium]|nr:type IV secretion system DNA-binding domain-containing protein [Candidatus Woesebacteria bacterium]